MMEAKVTYSAGERILLLISNSSTYPRATRFQIPSKIIQRKSAPSELSSIARK